MWIIDNLTLPVPPNRAPFMVRLVRYDAGRYLMEPFVFGATTCLPPRGQSETACCIHLVRAAGFRLTRVLMRRRPNGNTPHFIGLPRRVAVVGTAACPDFLLNRRAAS